MTTIYQIQQHFEEVLCDLSDCIVKAQQPIRVLDSIRWGSEIQKRFFAKNCKELPLVDNKCYEKKFHFV